MDHRGGFQKPVLPAHLAQRVFRKVDRADLFPGLAIALVGLAVTFVAVVVSSLRSGVVRTEPVLGQHRTPVMGAGFLGFTRH